MPRTVDADQQRSAIAGAVARLVASGGMEAVSLRAVAAEAGVSMGRVQHYFATKDDMLLDCLQRSYQRMEARIERRMEGTDGSEREILVAILDELLGAEAETRDAIRINTAFASRGLSDERVTAILTDGDQEIVALATRVIATAVHEGRADVDNPPVEGRALFALACGLGSGVALYGASLEEARAALAVHLHRVAPTAGRRSSPPA